MTREAFSLGSGVFVMPIEFDEIQRGRRREWDKLKDPEQRREEERRRREEDEELQEKKSRLKKKEEAKATQLEKDQEEWQRAKKQVIVIVSTLLAALAVYVGVKWTIGYAVRQTRGDRIDELAALVNSGEPYEGYDTALEAWATWRTAWIHRDAALLYRLYSPGQRKRATRKGSDRKFINSMQKRMEAGVFDKYVAIATQFSKPEIFRLPVSPSDGDLAVLKMTFHDPRLPEGSNEMVWVLALAFDGRLDRWGFEDLRSDDAWLDRWDAVDEISVRRERLEEP